MREVKYPEELAIMRDCATLTDYGQDRYMELLKPGMNVKAFDFQIAALIMEEAGRRFPEDRVEVRMMALAGKNSASPHWNWVNTPGTTSWRVQPAPRARRTTLRIGP